MKNIKSESPAANTPNIVEHSLSTRLIAVGLAGTAALAGIGILKARSDSTHPSESRPVATTVVDGTPPAFNPDEMDVIIHTEPSGICTTPCAIPVEK